MLHIAIKLAAQYHCYQFDKGGHPYIMHPLRLMFQFKDPELQQIAVLHDVVEDTELTLQNLAGHNFSDRVIDAIDCLTKREGEGYDEYIGRVASNIDAVRVKLADLKDNTDVTRLKGLRDKDFERMKKYHKTFLLLTSVLQKYEELDNA